MIELEEIRKTDFYLYRMPTLFAENKANKCFAKISNGIISYQLAWQSDLLKPIVLNIKQEIYCIGIDQYFCVIDFTRINILLNLKLMYNFYDVKIFQDWIFVICELEIIKINKDNLNIEDEFGLPDFFEKMDFENNLIKIKCLNNNYITL